MLKDNIVLDMADIWRWLIQNLDPSQIHAFVVNVFAMFLLSVALLLNNSVILPGQENIFPRDQTSHLLCPGQFLNRKCKGLLAPVFAAPPLELRGEARSRH